MAEFVKKTMMGYKEVPGGQSDPECTQKPELKLRANFRAGYWEASFLHTKPLGVVPPEMRVR